MKRTVIGFVVSALVLVALALWALEGHVVGNTQEIFMTAIILVLVGFAVFLGLSRLRSHRRREPAEDELSSQVMTASSAALHGSIYLWLSHVFSDKTSVAGLTVMARGDPGHPTPRSG